ncbi:MAG: hypothetical protein JOY90_30935 [Bradyrhizobium sp.]|nr:hypothetical protein [Bradyrhizobium sp.]
MAVAAAFTFFVAGSTAASADCRGEVETAFQKLEKPHRPYRSGVTAGGYRATIEFIPPDRVRLIVDSANDWLEGIPGSANWLRGILAYFAGPDPIETIQIGNRTWKRVNQKWLEYRSPKISPTGLPPLEMTSETAFACLEDIAFEGKTYAGYRISFPPTRGAVVVEFGADISKTQEEVSRAWKNAPPIWRTILVDRETGLPENQILSDKEELDSPISKIHYTYPSDLTIEPPAQ